ncbi:MAG: OmpA family protein [Bacteroidetes bacterium]|nr:OmpA family protein [Bacteroidota bacterium]
MRISTLPGVLLLLFITSNSFGQVDTLHVTKRYDMPRARTFRTLDIGVHFGMTYPNTDIAASDLFSSGVETKLAYGLTLTKFLSHNFGLQAQFITGKMSGKDKEKPNQYFFTTKVKYDVSLNAVFQVGNIAFLKRSPDLAIYGYVGVGRINFDPSRSIYVQNNFIDSTTVNYHNTTEIIFPFGLGAKYRINKNFSINAEYSLRHLNSDKLDGYFRLLSENDDYSYLNVGLIYHLGTKEKVLEWNNPIGDMYADLAVVKDKIDLVTKDSDKDGVADMFDREPDTPEGVKVYGDGTSVDSDGDGVPDFKDVEPYSSKGAKVDGSGKEIDADGDGIPDSRDLEPNTPKGTLVSNQGITIPVGKQQNEQGGNSALNVGSGYLPSVFFELDKAVIQKKYNETLASIGMVMKNYPDLKFELVGNCDIRANEDYNIKLGMRRAQAVKDHLVKRYGIDPSRMTITTKGKKEPITSQDHAMNRRVDFRVVQ